MRIFFEAKLQVMQICSSWLGYPDSDLFSWTEPATEPPDPPGTPGARGRPVELSPEQQREARRKASKHQLNLVASDLVPPNRTLEDHRNPK